MFGWSCNGTSICLYLKAASTRRLSETPATTAALARVGWRPAARKLHDAVSIEEAASNSRNSSPSVAYIAKLPALRTSA